jgi:endonuclease/exonuclease/phosphatase family metal-dependent hydrolase
MALKLVIVCIICISAIVLLYALGVVIYSSVTAFHPDPVLKLQTVRKGLDRILPDAELNILSWNIGYAGLGAEMDFFYEGGKMVRPDETQNQQYIKSIREFITKQDNLDFIMLQEVDFNSVRSYNLDQSEYINKSLNNYSYTTAINYKSGYVPLPVLDPMGKVKSGLITSSKYNPVESFRISSPGSYPWPKRLFMLRRCILLSKYIVDDGHELVLFNIHNSAYDDADALRNEELKLIKSLAMEEYKKSNYVIIGGDWNQNPPGLDLIKIKEYKVRTERPVNPDLMPNDWQWIYDETLPTNRDVNQPFDKDKTTCSLLDFFLVSPNVEVMEVRTFDLEFQHSDHLPVIIKIQLR